MKRLVSILIFLFIIAGYAFIGPGLEAQVQLTTLIDYDGGTNPVYVGESYPGTSVATAAWRIKKITYDASDNPVSVYWADHTATFTKVWSGRAAYDYSY